MKSFHWRTEKNSNNDDADTKEGQHKNTDFDDWPFLLLRPLDTLVSSRLERIRVLSNKPQDRHALSITIEKEHNLDGLRTPDNNSNLHLKQTNARKMNAAQARTPGKAHSGGPQALPRHARGQQGQQAKVRPQEDDRLYQEGQEPVGGPENIPDQGRRKP